MLIKTKYFGEIDLNEEKIITFEHGLMGFEEYKRYTVLYDIEEGEEAKISWLQSVDAEEIALPVISPVHVRVDYNPTVEDELLQPLGEINEKNLAILLVMSVPSEVKKATVNLKAPLIINSDTKMGRQIIVENQDYEIRYQIQKEEKGGE